MQNVFLRGRFAALLPLLLLLLLLLATGCPGLSYYSDDCGDEAACPGAACPGACVPLAPLGFDGPTFLWMGPESMAPECPAAAPRKVYEGKGNLDVSQECPPCSCTQPACELPAGVVASTVDVCPNDGPGATLTELDAPPGWDGSCTGTGTVPSNLLGSATVQGVTERACEPIPVQVPQNGGPPPSWGLMARACSGEVLDSSCNAAGETCLSGPKPAPADFRVCVMYLRDAEPICPPEYPDRFDFHRDLEDTRGCTACTCTQTAPSSCTARVSLHQGAGCEPASELHSYTVTQGPLCADIAPGMELRSMAASWLTNAPGACVPSGGEPVGEAVPIEATTFCCMPGPR
ncbi:MAG TPA: hypothetical protein VLS89_17175 [Candidatus Nanopelagicales bacterium]|nr:hypothetical protein [Candidatus Nanopelagicales bacterium]